MQDGDNEEISNRTLGKGTPILYRFNSPLTEFISTENHRFR